MNTTQAARLLQQFIPHAGCAEVLPVGAGNINDTYAVTATSSATPEQCFILQRLNHHIFREPDRVMDNWVQVTSHLAVQPDYTYAIPVPLRTLRGGWLHEDETGNFWRMFPFFENTEAPEKRADVYIAREAAHAYGAFARALRAFPAENLAETLVGFHDTEQRWTVFEEVLRADSAGRVRQIQEEIGRLRATRIVTHHIAALKASGDLPLRVTHNDTKAGNVLLHRDTGKAVAVIDLDTVMPGTLLSDFGDMVRTFVPSMPEDAKERPHIRGDIYEALETVYLEETGGFLSATERAYLPLGGLWLCAEQALRFLSDYAAGDVYYKIRSADHNLVRARNQLSVFESLFEYFVSVKKEPCVAQLK